MNRLPCLLMAFVGWVSLISACENADSDRPPPLRSGGSSGVFPPINIGGGAGEGSVGGNGTGGKDPVASGGRDTNGAGGRTGTGGGDDRSVFATLLRFTSDNFIQSSGYKENCVVAWVEAGGSELESVVSEGGGVELSVPSEGEAFWIATKPASDPSIMPTLSFYDPSLEDLATGEMNLELVPESLLSEIVATTSSAPVLTGAQLLMRFFDKTGQPLSGVSVVYVEGGLDFTYSAGNTWSEFRDNSSADGLALYYNIAAGSYPGDLRTVTLAGSIKGNFEVQLATGWVTVASFHEAP